MTHEEMAETAAQQLLHSLNVQIAEGEAAGLCEELSYLRRQREALVKELADIEARKPIAPIVISKRDLE